MKANVKVSRKADLKANAKAYLKANAESGLGNRLWTFVRGSYPPLSSAVVALAWTYGLTGLFAAFDPRIATWRPGLATTCAAITVALDLLIMRVLDDIRDLDYDRIFNPGRPLAAGTVRTQDLRLLCGAAAALLVVLNAAAALGTGTGWPLAILIGQLAYGGTVVTVHTRWCWPRGDNLLANLMVSLPIPVLLNLYLYASYLQVTGLDPGRWGVVAVVVVALAAGHPEIAKKITRTPRPGERSYVNSWGLHGSVAAAVLAPLSSVALILSEIKLSALSAGIAVAPLLVVALAWWRFTSSMQARWQPTFALLFMLMTFVSYLGLGLLA